MSIAVMQRVWSKAPYKSGTLIILLALADFADDDGICYPSIPTLAEKARLTERQALSVVQALDKDGAIVYLPGNGRGNMSRYLVLTGLASEEMQRLCQKRAKDENFSPFSERVKSLLKGEISAIKGEISSRERVKSPHKKNRQFTASQSAETAQSKEEIRHVDPSYDPKTLTNVRAAQAPAATAPLEIELDEIEIAPAEQSTFLQASPNTPQAIAPVVKQSTRGAYETAPAYVIWLQVRGFKFGPQDRKLIAEHIGDDPTRLEVWQHTLRVMHRERYRPANIEYHLKRFEADLAAREGKGNEKDRGSGLGNRAAPSAEALERRKFERYTVGWVDGADVAAYFAEQDSRAAAAD